MSGQSMEGKIKPNNGRNFHMLKKDLCVQMEMAHHMLYANTKKQYLSDFYEFQG